jgi:hypothetical protein
VDAYVATDKDEKLHKIHLEASERKLVKADFQYHEADNPKPDKPEPKRLESA